MESKLQEPTDCWVLVEKPGMGFILLTNSALEFQYFTVTTRSKRSLQDKVIKRSKRSLPEDSDKSTGT